MTREDAIYWIKNLAVLSTKKDMPQIEEALNMAIEALADRTTESTGYNLSPVEDEPQTERKCIDCKFLTYRFNKVWCDIKCDNPHDKVCDRYKLKDESQTDCAWR